MPGTRSLSSSRSGGIGGSPPLSTGPEGLPAHSYSKDARTGRSAPAFQIGPNAFHAFDYLGIGDAARAKASTSTSYLDGRDEGRAHRLDPLDEPFPPSGSRNPYAVVHRPTCTWCCSLPARPAT